MIVSKTIILIELCKKHKGLDIFTLLEPMEKYWLEETKKVHNFELDPFYISKEEDLQFLTQNNKKREEKNENG